MSKASLRYSFLVAVALGLSACATSPDSGPALAARDLSNTLESRPGAGTCLAAPAATPPAMTARGSAGSGGPMIGLTAGAVVASAMMVGLAPRLSLEDQEALEKRVQGVLESELDGREIDWKAREAGQGVKLRPGKTRSDFREITVPRAEEVGRTPDSFRVETGRYVTTSATPLRPSPSAAADVRIDTVGKGQVMEVFGRVRGLSDDSWLLVGQHGVAFGYVDPSQLEPAGVGGSRPLYNRTTGGVLRDSVSATVTCRELVYATANGEQAMLACRGPDGRWIADPPAGSARGGACLPVNRAYLLR